MRRASSARRWPRERVAPRVPETTIGYGARAGPWPPRGNGHGPAAFGSGSAELEGADVDGVPLNAGGAVHILGEVRAVRRGALVQDVGLDGPGYLPEPGEVV